MIIIVLLALTLSSMYGQTWCNLDLRLSFDQGNVTNSNPLNYNVENHNVDIINGDGIFNILKVKSEDSYLKLTRKQPLKNKEYLIVETKYRLLSGLDTDETANVFSMLPPAGQATTGNNIEVSIRQTGRNVTLNINNGNGNRCEAFLQNIPNGGDVWAKCCLSVCVYGKMIKTILTFLSLLLFT